MKKYLMLSALFAAIFFSACEQSVNAPVVGAASAEVSGATVTGSKGVPIESTDITITIYNEKLKTAIAANADLSGWIFNLPPGLSAKAAALAPANGTNITLTIEGIPLDVRTESIIVKIPELVLSGNKALTVNENAAARFDITLTNAVVDAITVVGIKNIPIEAKEMTVRLITDTFQWIAQNTDLRSWITNLPAGLNAKPI
jgi:hypothetical protein